MDTHNIDTIIRETLDNSADFYEKQAMESKLKIWNAIQNQNKPQKNKITWFLIAASLMLLFSSSYLLTKHTQKTKTLSIVSNENQVLKNQLKESVNLYQQQKLALGLLEKPQPDTVFIEKEIVRYISKLETINTVDTVFLEKVVYVEKKTDDATILNNNMQEVANATINSSSAMQINYIQNNNQKAKQKRFKVNFGGNNESEGSNNLAFKTEL